MQDISRTQKARYKEPKRTSSFKGRIEQNLTPRFQAANGIISLHVGARRKKNYFRF